MKLPLLLTLALLATTAFADPLPIDGKFRYFSFGGTGATVSPASFTATFSAPAFVDVSDYQCKGDQFEVVLDSKSLGTTSTPVYDGCGIVTNDPNVAIADKGWSSGRFYVSSGAHTINIKMSLSPYGGGSGVIRATLGKCQGPPTSQADNKFALVVDGTGPVSFSAYPSTCAKYGLDPAQITSTNIQAALLALRACLTTMGKAGSPAWVQSWNGDTYGGTPIALYPSTTSSAGTVNIAADPQFSLCQAKPTVLESSFAGYSVVGRTPDQKLFVVGPPVPYSKASDACASFGGASPAVLSSAKQDLYAAASSLVFGVTGPMGKAWIGGYETKTPNVALTLSVGAVSGPGSVNPPDVSTPTSLYVVCAAPGSGADKKRREPEPEPEPAAAANKRKREPQPEPEVSDEL